MDALNRRGAGAADRGGLENRCGPCDHRGFESHPLRSLRLLRGCKEREPLRSFVAPRM
jgi:hypothetical protein